MIISMTKTQIRKMIKPRKPDAHKGDFGRLLVYAGSMGMVGAAILCGKAALRTGAGLVQFYLPKDLIPIVQGALPEATAIERGTLEDYDGYRALIIGPGLGRYSEDKGKLLSIFQHYSGTIVLDADGLNWLRDGELRQAVENSGAEIIMTPHPGEARTLLENIGITETRRFSRQEQVQMIQAGYGHVVLLKGADTLVALDQERIYRNTTGNPGMATAGSGDVLSGIIAGLVGQGYSLEEASLLGPYLHGLSGDLVCETQGEEGLIAGDLVEGIPQAWKQLKDTGGNK